jgi:hypothetical protein
MATVWFARFACGLHRARIRTIVQEVRIVPAPRGAGPAMGRDSAARDAFRELGHPGTGLALSSGMLLLLIILLLLAALGGGFGYSRYGYGSWSPAAIVVVILVIMLLTGRL